MFWAFLMLGVRDKYEMSTNRVHKSTRICVLISFSSRTRLVLLRTLCVLFCTLCVQIKIKRKQMQYSRVNLLNL